MSCAKSTSTNASLMTWWKWLWSVIASQTFMLCKSPTEFNRKERTK